MIKQKKPNKKKAHGLLGGRGVDWTTHFWSSLSLNLVGVTRSNVLPACQPDDLWSIPASKGCHVEYDSKKTVHEQVNEAVRQDCRNAHSGRFLTFIVYHKAIILPLNVLGVIAPSNGLCWCALP